MKFGKIELYDSSMHAESGKLTLTLIGQGDASVLSNEGLSALRRKRTLRLASEAYRQGRPLRYSELADLLFTSVATLKRDVRDIESSGEYVPLRGRRRVGASGTDGRTITR